MTNITIPKQLNGDLVAVPKKEYQLFNRFLELVDLKQVYFWTKEWQAMERQADRDVALGRISKIYSNSKDLKKALNLLKK